MALKTCRRRWTIGRSGEKGSGISVPTARHDDDENHVNDDAKVKIFSLIFQWYFNAPPHTNIKTKETITSFGCTTLRQPLYSPYFVTSDYHLFGIMKESLRGKYYASDEEMKTVLMKWLKEQSVEFYEAGIHALIRRRNIAIERNGDYVKK